VSRKYRGNKIMVICPGEASEVTSDENYFENWVATCTREIGFSTFTCSSTSTFKELKTGFGRFRRGHQDRFPLATHFTPTPSFGRRNHLKTADLCTRCHSGKLLLKRGIIASPPYAKLEISFVTFVSVITHKILFTTKTKHEIN